MAPSERDTRILEVTPMIRAIAWNFKKRMPMSTVDVEDLAQEAMAGVCRAVDMWDPKGGASWSNYAHTRATGAIQDFLRKWPLGGRNHWREFSMISTERPVAGVDGPITLGDTLVSPGRLTEDLPDRDLPGQLGGLLSALLTLDEQSAVHMHYGDGYKLATIGLAMGVSESRVSQLLKSARSTLSGHQVRELLGV